MKIILGLFLSLLTLTSLVQSQNDQSNIENIIQNLESNNNLKLIIENVKSILEESLNSLVSNTKGQDISNLKSERSTNNLSFVHIDHIIDAAEAMVEGLLDGFAKNSESNCKKELLQYKATIIISVIDIFNALVERKDYFKYFLQAFKGLSRIPNVSDCKFKVLGNKLENLTKGSEAAALGKRMLINLPLFIGYTAEAVKGGMKQDFFLIGKSTAKIFSTALDFTTD